MSHRPRPDDRGTRGEAADPDRARAVAASRARRTARRFAVGNGLDRLVTLTFADEPDVDGMWQAVRAFDQRCRRAGVDFRARVDVPEWGDENGRLHCHRLHGAGYIPHEQLVHLWGEGFVDVRRVDSFKDGTPIPEPVRPVIAALYLTGYMCLNDERRDFDRKRYSVSRGHQPRTDRYDFMLPESARLAMATLLPGAERFSCRSSDVEGYVGPPWWFTAAWPDGYDPETRTMRSGVNGA